MRTLALAAALAAGGCVSPSAAIQLRIADITEDGARAHVDALAKIGPRPWYDAEASRRTVAYLAERLRALGLQPVEEPFDAEGDRRVREDDALVMRRVRVGQRNVIVELTGETEPDRILEIGAHYDTVPGTVGADDNASGVAGLLEIARVLAGTRHERTIRLCFFAKEEYGLAGSGAHVARILAEEPHRDLEGILVLEMIGYTSTEPDSQESPVRIPLLLYPPTTGDFIAVVGNISSGGLGNVWEGAADDHVPELRYYSLNRIGAFFGDAARSDHFQYWRAGLDGIMLTDTANFRTPHYHRPSDTPDTLDYVFLRDVARATAAAAMAWARPILDSAIIENPAVEHLLADVPR